MSEKYETILRPRWKMLWFSINILFSVKFFSLLLWAFAHMNNCLCVGHLQWIQTNRLCIMSSNPAHIFQKATPLILRSNGRLIIQSPSLSSTAAVRRMSHQRDDRNQLMLAGTLMIEHSIRGGVGVQWHIRERELSEVDWWAKGWVEFIFLDGWICGGSWKFHEMSELWKVLRLHLVREVEFGLRSWTWLRNTEWTLNEWTLGEF